MKIWSVSRLGAAALFLCLSAPGAIAQSNPGQSPTYKGLKITGEQKLPINPSGNSAITGYTSNITQATTSSETNAEFGAYIGMISTKRSGLTNPAKNTAALYTGIECRTGSGWCWSQNPLTYLAPGFDDGGYVSEMDLQNAARHYDTGLSPPAAWVLNLSYGSTQGYRGNGYMLVSGTGGEAYTHYGIVFTNDPIKNDTGYTIWDNGNAFTSYRVSGTHAYGVDTSPATLIKAFRFGPNQGVYARNAANNADIRILAVDGSDNVLLGHGSTGTIFAYNTIAPNAAESVNLGGLSLPFSFAFANTFYGSKVTFKGASSGTLDVVAPAVASGVLTLPAATDTVVARKTTDTLENKTRSAPDINGGTADALASLGVRSSGTGAFDLQIKNTENLTADRALTVALGNASRTLILSGNPTLGDWFDQSVKTSAAPTFAGFTVGGADAAKIGLFKGANYGVRFGANGTTATLEGVDAATGTSSYQPLSVNGSTLSLQKGGTTQIFIDANANVVLGAAALSTSATQGFSTCTRRQARRLGRQALPTLVAFQCSTTAPTTRSAFTAVRGAAPQLSPEECL